MAKKTFSIDNLGQDDMAGAMEAVGNVAGAIGPNATKAGKGKAIGSTIGNIAGAAIPIPGAGQVIGAVTGALGELIGGAKDRREAAAKLDQVEQRTGNALKLTPIMDAYGPNASFYAEDGLALEEGSPNEMVSVNIERGEIEIDPVTGDIVREFSGKRYRPHAPNKKYEPISNFIKMKSSNVIIPKNKAKLYKEGDNITRSSILAEIVKNTALNGVETNKGAEYAKGGKPPRVPVGGYEGEKKLLASLKLDLDGKKRPSESSSTIRINRVPVHPNKTLGTITANRIELDGIEDLEIDRANRPDLELPEYILPEKESLLNDITKAQILNTLPTVVGGAMAMQNDPTLRYVDPSMEDAISAIEAMPTDVYNDDVTASGARARAGIRQAMNNTASPANRAVIADNTVGIHENEAMAALKAKQTRAQIIQQKLAMTADMKGKQAAARAGAVMKFQDDMSKDIAARGMMAHSAVSEGGVNAAKSIMDNERVRAIQSMGKYFTVKPGSNELIVSNPEELLRVIENVGSGLGYVDPTTPVANPKKRSITEVNMQRTDGRGRPTGTTTGRVVRYPG